MSEQPPQPPGIPDPPYFAVIFTSTRTPCDNGYAGMAARMEELAARMEGFLGIESARDESGLGITVSYWTSLESIRNWREQSEHLVAQRLGRETWYDSFQVRICRVERAYGFGRS